MARETLAVQEIVPDTTLVRVLCGKLQTHIIAKRDLEAGLGISDVDHIGAVVFDRAN